MCDREPVWEYPVRHRSHYATSLPLMQCHNGKGNGGGQRCSSSSDASLQRRDSAARGFQLLNLDSLLRCLR